MSKTVLAAALAAGISLQWDLDSHKTPQVNQGELSSKVAESVECNRKMIAEAMKATIHDLARLWFWAVISDANAEASVKEWQLSNIMKVEKELNILSWNENIPSNASSTYMWWAEFMVWRENADFYIKKTLETKVWVDTLEWVVLIDWQTYAISSEWDGMKIKSVIIDKKYLNLANWNIHLANVLAWLEGELYWVKDEFIAHKLETSRSWQRFKWKPAELDKKFDTTVLSILGDVADDRIDNTTLEFLFKWWPEWLTNLSWMTQALEDGKYPRISWLWTKIPEIKVAIEQLLSEREQSQRTQEQSQRTQEQSQRTQAQLESYQWVKKLLESFNKGLNKLWKS